MRIVARSQDNLDPGRIHGLAMQRSDRWAAGVLSLATVDGATCLEALRNWKVSRFSLSID